MEQNHDRLKYELIIYIFITVRHNDMQGVSKAVLDKMSYLIATWINTKGGATCQLHYKRKCKIVSR